MNTQVYVGILRNTALTFRILRVWSVTLIRSGGTNYGCRNRSPLAKNGPTHREVFRVAVTSSSGSLYSEKRVNKISEAA